MVVVVASSVVVIVALVVVLSIIVALLVSFNLDASFLFAFCNCFHVDFNFIAIDLASIIQQTGLHHCRHSIRTSLWLMGRKQIQMDVMCIAFKNQLTALVHLLLTLFVTHRKLVLKFLP